MNIRLSKQLFFIASELDRLFMAEKQDQIDNEQLENIASELECLSIEEKQDQIDNKQLENIASELDNIESSNNTGVIQKTLGIPRQKAQTLEKVFTPKTVSAKN